MAASKVSEISDVDIEERLPQVSGCSVEYCGTLSEPEKWDSLAREKLCGLTVADVRRIVDRAEIVGDSALEEIDMAISIAAEPDEMPSNACVALFFDD